MEINIVCVGKKQEAFLADAVREYQKRISAYAKINLITTKDYPCDGSNAQILISKQKEALELEKHKKGFLIALEIDGKNFSSQEFAKKLDEIFLKHSTITFFIGGSNGLDKNFSDSCNLKLSFSHFTFPHQLMRVILLEQIYRAFTIIHGTPYHK